MRTEQEMKEVIGRMVEALGTMSDGTEISVCGVLEAAGYDVNDFDIGDLMDLSHDVTLAAGQKNILLDWSGNLYRLDGLPFVLEFSVSHIGAA